MQAENRLGATLAESIENLNIQVRSHVTDAKLRIQLAELLSMAGNLTRADLQLEAAARINPSLQNWITIFRHLLRAEQSRRDLFEQGRVPEFVGSPTPLLTSHLKALVALRQGHGDEAANLLALAETQRSSPGRICNGQRVEEFRDMNDLTAHFFEVLTGAGAYFWIAFDQIATMRFLPPQRPRDLLWCRAIVSVRQGPQGEVFIPALYAGSHEETNSDTIRCGKATDWINVEGGVVRGLGQRCFLAGEADLPIMSLETLGFSTS
ncbi:MAG: hypothetical protein H7833_06115 [Magnetococcus sp. DMHC-1]